MIKSLRNVTRLLGKLNLKCCVVDNHAFYAALNAGRPAGFPLAKPQFPGRYVYGRGLKEAKDAVEGYLARREQPVKPDDGQK